MPNKERIQIKKDILYWALQESQKEDEEIINKFPKIAEWMKGEQNPTFKQLECFADFLKIPFGYLFLETPPRTDIMEVEFRTIKNKHPFISKNLKDTITAMDIKRNWMSDYRKELGWGKLAIIENYKQQQKNVIKDDASIAKHLLGLKDNWYEKTKNHGEAYNLLKEKMETNGIIVMQNGVVGNNTRRKLDIEEFRAFMLYDDIAPIIFINNNDSISGKIFSLVHEYIHILFELEDVLLEEDILIQKENEGYINQMTGEFLMPADYIRLNWSKTENIYEQINQLSIMFKVSETALAIKLQELKLISKSILEFVIDEGIKNFEKGTVRTDTGGGDFYNTFNTRISPTFTKAVIRSTEAGDTSYGYAFRLLGGIKGKTYDEIKERFLPYG